MSRRLIFVPLLAAFLVGCGTHPAAAPTLAVASKASAQSLPNISGPIKACAVLAYANAAAHGIDPKAVFQTMSGTHIDETGAPQAGGSWILQYVGDEVPAPAGVVPNPYMPYLRHLTISVDAQGHVHSRQTKQAGMPLGVALMSDPNPPVDSCDVYNLFYSFQKNANRTVLETLTLQGMVGPNHFDHLVWRVGAGTQSQPDVLIDASSGAVLDGPHTATP